MNRIYCFREQSRRTKSYLFTIEYFYVEKQYVIKVHQLLKQYFRLNKNKIIVSTFLSIFPFWHFNQAGMYVAVNPVSLYELCEQEFYLQLVANDATSYIFFHLRIK